MSHRQQGLLSLSGLLPWLGVAVAAQLLGCTARDRSEGDTRLDTTATRSLRWVAVREREIYRPGTAQPFGTVTPGLIAAAGGDRLAVFDDVSGRVLLLSDLGDSLGVIGRRGRGPGEFQSPSGIGMGADGSIAVFDVAKASVLRFTPEGTPLPEVRITGMHEGGPLQVTARGVAMGVVEIGRRDRSLLHRLLFLADSGNTVELASVHEPLPVASRFPGCPNPVVLAPMFAPKLRWAGMGNVIVAASESGYVLEYFRMGQSPIRVARPNPPMRATRSLALAVSRSGRLVQQAGTCSVSPEQLLDARGMSETVPEVSRLTVAPNGEVWVRHGDLRPDGGGLAVHSGTGEYIGTLSASFPFPAVFLDTLRFVAVEPDTDEVNHLYVYRLVR